MTLVSELAQSPAVVERLVRSARGPLTALAGRVEQRGIDAVFLAARGTSDHAATYAQYVLGIRNRLDLLERVPAEGQETANQDRYLVIGRCRLGGAAPRADQLGLIEQAERHV